MVVSRAILVVMIAVFVDAMKERLLLWFELGYVSVIEVLIWELDLDLR